MFSNEKILIYIKSHNVLFHFPPFCCQCVADWHVPTPQLTPNRPIPSPQIAATKLAPQPTPSQPTTTLVANP
jgi:hypothetical protein